MSEDQDDEVLRRMAQGLGTRAADQLDVEVTAAAVIQRLRTEVGAERGTWRPWTGPRWLLAAAAVALVLGAGVLLRPHPRAVHRAHYVADDLRDLSTDELRDVLGTLDQTLAQPAAVEPTEEDLNDLTTEQLERLLESLEG